MATIYDLKSGYAITEGLQGSRVCDQAMKLAKDEAKARKRRVLLDDDDGQWLVGPVRVVELTEARARKLGMEWALSGDPDQ